MASQVEPRPQPQLVREVEPRITWVEYPHIEPGEYAAASGRAFIYFDRFFNRHVCLVRFTVVDDGGGDVLARLPWFLNLGSGPRPRAGRRGRYWNEWLRANGRPPKRRDRLAPRVFEHRAARVQVGDTTMPFREDREFDAYSVIREVLRWETG